MNTRTSRVARMYAVILALLGMVVVMVRSLREGVAFEDALLNCTVWMAILAIVGLIVGAIAQLTIDESVRMRVQAELDALGAGNQEGTLAVKN